MANDSIVPRTRSASLRRAHDSNAKSRTCVRLVNGTGAKARRAERLAMSVAVGTMTVPVSMVVLTTMMPAAVVVAIMGLSVSIDRPTWRGHDYRWSTWAWRYHNRRGITDNHARQRRQRKAKVDVYTCLGSGSRSDENRCEHKHFFHTLGWTETLFVCLAHSPFFPTFSLNKEV